jgi:hypothetical protein
MSKAIYNIFKQNNYFIVKKKRRINKIKRSEKKKKRKWKNNTKKREKEQEKAREKEIVRKFKVGRKQRSISHKSANDSVYLNTHTLLSFLPYLVRFGNEHFIFLFHSKQKRLF